MSHSTSARVSSFPATSFLADAIKVQMGNLTVADLRRNWKEGKYDGLDPEYAKWVIGNL